RRRWYLLGCLLMLVFTFPYFLLFNTRNPVLVILTIVLSLALCHAFVYGPQAALIAERFSTKLRYSGASLGYQLAAPFAGGLSPLIAVTLLAKFGGDSTPIALFIIILAAFSFMAVLGLKEFTRKDIAADATYAIQPEEDSATLPGRSPVQTIAPEAINPVP
nr:hypothetical protein [Chloroflexota bacterium]